MYLENIKGVQDVKNLQKKELKTLAEEMRTALLQKLSRHGGHIGPNLGMVETAIALHYVFDSPTDKMVFDVSHQSYCHKMLTGRSAAFLQEEHYDDVSGYTNPQESEHDFFNIGHTSTSISLAAGLAKARDLHGESYNVIAVIGDGSLSGGEALEGLNFAHELQGNLIIIVNDNDMSIAENHGGLYENLKLLRETRGTAPCNLFHAMGLDYVFVEDGNDLEQLISAFLQVKGSAQPIVVHICTQKGKGYAMAELHKENWHWNMPFHLEDGSPVYAVQEEDYGELTARYLLKEMRKDASVVAITSGTPSVFGFHEERRKQAGKQFVDVGIAEEHAVALASGIAANNGKPVYGVYSSFIQRTYDQLSQDLCINHNPALLLVFAASVYGMNDVTHLGIFDIAMLSNIPNLVYLAPTCKEEYEAMMAWGLHQKQYPVAVRVPGPAVESRSDILIQSSYEKLNTYQVTQVGHTVAILALGSFYSKGKQLADALQEQGIQATLINPRFITGQDTELLENLKENHTVAVTLEDGILDGGFGEKIARFYGNSDMKVLNYGLKKAFIDRYDVEEILKENRLQVELMLEDIQHCL